jgi:hypothetical protein
MAILSPAMNVVAGGPVVPSKEVVAPSPLPPSSYFRANELDLGAFATLVYIRRADNRLRIYTLERFWNQPDSDRSRLDLFLEG